MNSYKVASWLSVGAAVAVAVCMTHSGWWLWFFMISVLLSTIKEEKHE